MSLVACPQCGESDDLSGERVDTGVRVTCQACSYQWLRAAAPALTGRERELIGGVSGLRLP